MATCTDSRCHPPCVHPTCILADFDSRFDVDPSARSTVVCQELKRSKQETRNMALLRLGSWPWRLARRRRAGRGSGENSCQPSGQLCHVSQSQNTEDHSTVVIVPYRVSLSVSRVCAGDDSRCGLCALQQPEPVPPEARHHPLVTSRPQLKPATPSPTGLCLHHHEPQRPWPDAPREQGHPRPTAPDPRRTS